VSHSLFWPGAASNSAGLSVSTNRYEVTQDSGHRPATFSRHRLLQLPDSIALDPPDLPVTQAEVGGKLAVAHWARIAIQTKAALDHTPLAQVEAT
jgi:hypothetical protein